MPEATAPVASVLQEIGFTPPQEKAYRALMANPSLTVPELAPLVGLPAAEIPALAAGLVRLGVARFDPAARAGVTLANPAVTLGALVDRLEADLLRRHQRVSDVRAQLPGLCQAYARSAPVPGAAAAANEGGIERLDSVEAVRERLEELSFFTRYSVYSVQPGGPQSADSLRASRPLDLRALRRGIDMRVIHEATVLDDEMNRTYLLELTAAGASIRLTKEPLERFIVMDKRIAVVPIDPAESRCGALVVEQPGLLTGLLALFQRLWADSWDAPWISPCQIPDEMPTEEDHRILQLLALGATDDTVARQVGISVRQLRRRIARLMTRLNAPSRFAAGAAAARRGWI